MWLRWVVTNLLHQVAQEKVREAVERAKKHIKNPNAQVRGGAEVPRDELRCDLVLLYALGIESGGLVDRMVDVVTTECPSFVERVGKLEGRPLAVAESGVGRQAAARAAEDLIKIHRPAWIVSAGFAAALTAELRCGHILMANAVTDERRKDLDVGLHIDPRSLDAVRAMHVGRLLTVDRMIRDPDEKRKLAAEFAAVACDMETMAVAQVCRRRQVRFLSVRIISDGLDDTLPAEVEHMLNQQSFAGKLGAATRAVFQRPSCMKDMWKLRETALRASDRLAKFLAGVISQLETRGNPTAM
jgi:adenosylhomocysteine nucleosidase